MTENPKITPLPALYLLFLWNSQRMSGLLIEPDPAFCQSLVFCEHFLSGFYGDSNTLRSPGGGSLKDVVKYYVKLCKSCIEKIFKVYTTIKKYVFVCSALQKTGRPLPQDAASNP
ncbi:MAG: hypothetical protein LUQ31_10985 [Methanoregula sp.]|nr:hypothetical protein [Methanoregula sp.]